MVVSRDRAMDPDPDHFRPAAHSSEGVTLREGVRPRMNAPSTPRPSVLLRISEAAAYLGVSRSRLYELILADPPVIPSVKLGRARRVHIEALNAWAATIAGVNGGAK